MAHFIQASDVDSTKEHKQNLAGAYGNGERKNLYLVSSLNPLQSWLEVENHGETIYKGTDINAAIAAYNIAKSK